MKRHLCYSLLLLICTSLILTETSSSRENILSGSISVRQGYDNNINRTDSDHISRTYTTILPGITLNSRGSNDNFTFDYSIGYTEDNERTDSEIDHYLSLVAEKDVSSQFRIEISEAYTRSDNSYLYAEGVEREIVLTGDRINDRFWTNEAAIRTDFEYYRDSILSFGYIHNILDNESLTSSDYVRHNPFVELSYRFSPQWSILTTYNYINGNFDFEDDLETHNPSIRLNYRSNPQNLYFGTYEYNETDYDGTSVDYEVHIGHLGWEHQIDHQTDLVISAGAAEIDNPNEQAFSYDALLIKRLQRGVLTIEGSGGIDERQFLGENDGDFDDLTKFWSAGSTLTFQLAERISSDMNVVYRNDEFINRSPVNTEKSFTAGLGLSWNFYRWFTIATRYSYRQVDADIASDDYDNHRVYVELSAAKELWRW